MLFAELSHEAEDLQGFASAGALTARWDKQRRSAHPRRPAPATTRHHRHRFPSDRRAGTALTHYFIAEREKQAKQHELATTRQISIAKLSALNPEYPARAEIFLAAVDRGDAGGAKELNAVFDDVAIRWRTETSPTLMAARDVLPPEVYVRFRDRLNAEFRERFLVPFGEYLERGRQLLDARSPMNRTRIARPTNAGALVPRSTRTSG
jgi:hypothetical protein